MINIQKSSLHPRQSAEKKQNCKIYYSIKPDGTVVERVFLDIPDPRAREDIIAVHFLKYCERLFWKKSAGKIKIVGRDNPWDFIVNIGYDEVLNLEITSIADSKEFFVKLKREEIVKSFLLADKIRIRDLIKLGTFSPELKHDELIERELANGKTKDDIIPNPLYKTNPGIWISDAVTVKEKISKKIINAIIKKENKSHPEKEKTILIIDNRSLQYELNDLLELQSEYSNFLSGRMFMEIWIYNGYYSDYECIDCEFSFVPLKISDEKIRVLERYAMDNPPGEDGIILVGN